jgi:hypothetical protein
LASSPGDIYADRYQLNSNVIEKLPPRHLQGYPFETLAQVVLLLTDDRVADWLI